MADDGGLLALLPTDAFLEVLLRLPTSARRRFRLVCKRWRDVIDERTPERQVRTKTLAFVSQGSDYRALVVDADDGPREWTFRSSNVSQGVVHLVGTCNGLLCLRDRAPPAWPRYARALSAITVVNPATGETLALPREPGPWALEGGGYSFGCHPTTGEYKVVHVSRRKVADASGTVLVITLGDAAWREVPVFVRGSGYNDAAGVVTVDGSTYWLSEDADRVMALDLADEGVRPLEAPPAARACLQVPEKKATYHLTSVHARLGLVVARRHKGDTRVNVWALEGRGGGARGRQQPRWSRWYSLVEPRSPGGGHWITAPHFAHGEYVLSGLLEREAVLPWLGVSEVYRRKAGELASDGAMDARPHRPVEGAERIMCMELPRRAVFFPYVQTTEPVPGVRR